MASQLIVAAEAAFRSGNVGRAEDLLVAFLRQSPRHAKANELMGYIAANRGDFDRAQAFLTTATSSRDGSAEAWYYLGRLLLQRGRYETAATALRRALRMAGDFFEGLHDLAVATAKGGRPLEALPLFERAEALRGASVELLNNKGSALNACDKLEQALDVYAAASALDPSQPMPWLNRAMTLIDLGRHDEALSCYRTALAIMPPSSEAWRTLGRAAYALNRHDEALAHFRQALVLDPNDPYAQAGMGVTLLALGRFPEGFKLYEARWHTPEAEAERHRQIPRWQGGSDISGRRILLWSELGYGDTIQFCRFATLVASRGADVTIEVPPALKSLISTLGAGRVVGLGEAGTNFDLQIPLVSLPLVLGTTCETIPRAAAYLHSDPRLQAKWREQLGPARRRVAIACSGNIQLKNDRIRRMPLFHFAPLRDFAELLLVQKDLGPSDREFLQQSSGAIRYLGDELGDFADTAAILSNVDLVITVDTSLAHLAGALGKAVWILLPWAAEWRWLVQRTDSPWYPTARLIRQQKPEDWTAVMSEVQQSVRRWSIESRAGR